VAVSAARASQDASVARSLSQSAAAWLAGAAAITSLIYTALFNVAKAQMADRAEELVWKVRPRLKTTRTQTQLNLQLKIPDKNLISRPSQDHQTYW
jgi:hypothetical protein